MKYCVAGEGLTDEVGADDFVVTRDEVAVGLFGEEEVVDARDEEGVADAEDDGGDESVEGGGDEGFLHGGGPWWC